MSWEFFVFVGIATFLVFKLWREAWLYKHRHIGTGGYLRCTKEGDWYVSTSLLASPMGRAHIPIGAAVIAINGVPLKGKTLTEVAGLFRRIEGESVTYTLLDGKTRVPRDIPLIQETIQGPIPEYRQGYIEDHRLTRGMALCLRTGQVIPTQRLTDEAILSVLR